MEVKTVHIGDKDVSEVVSSEVLIKDTQGALDIMGETGTEYIILQKHHFTPDFFDLSTRKLGNVLQKFTNYRIKIAIIGDFQKDASETFKDFMYESNRHGEYLFVTSNEDVMKYWGKQPL